MDPTNNFYILTFLFGHGETRSGRFSVMLYTLLFFMFLSILGILLSEKNARVRKICNIYTLMILFLMTVVFFINIRWQILDMNSMNWWKKYISGLILPYFFLFFVSQGPLWILKKSKKFKYQPELSKISDKSNCSSIVFPIAGMLLGLIYISIKILQ